MRLSRLCRETSGAALVITALLIVTAAGAMVLAVDLGHLYLVKSELQRAADAGAMAGALGLFPITPGGVGPLPMIPNCPLGLAASQAVVAANQADGGGLTLPSADVYFGKWDLNTSTFDPIGCASPPLVNAVKVEVRRDRTANGPVALFFTGLMGESLNSVELRARAVALTGFPGFVPAGAHAFPMAVDNDKVPPEHSRETIRVHLNPTPTDSGAWHTFDDKSPGASDLRGLVDGSIPSPPLQVGDFIKVKEGVSDSVLQEVDRQWTQRGEDWTVLMPVIPEGCHTGWAEVLGFVAFKITAVDSHGEDKYVEGYTVPDYVAPGTAPGGANYGLWAGAPKLVQ